MHARVSSLPTGPEAGRPAPAVDDGPPELSVARALPEPSLGPPGRFARLGHDMESQKSVHPTVYDEIYKQLVSIHKQIICFGFSKITFSLFSLGLSHLSRGSIAFGSLSRPPIPRRVELGPRKALLMTLTPPPLGPKYGDKRKIIT